MNSLFSVKEKVILLTGGYGILGACMAKHLAREGAYVVILGRNEQKGSALVNEIKAEGGEQREKFVVVDVEVDAVENGFAVKLFGDAPELNDFFHG